MNDLSGDVSISGENDVPPVGRDQELQFLRKRHERLLAIQRYTKGSAKNTAVTACLSVLVAAVLSGITHNYKGYWIFQENGKIGGVAWASLVLMFSACIMAIVTLSDKSKLRDLDRDLEQIEFQIDLSSYEISKEELKAEKLVRLNDFQLRRYYELNLNQNKWIFTIGIGCILAGIGILVATLYTINRVPPSDTTMKISTAVLGAVGAILTNYVAAIYLKMSASAGESLASFHGRLVETQRFMLGNLIVSRIEDDEVRWEAVSSMAIAMAGAKETPKKAEAPKAVAMPVD